MELTVIIPTFRRPGTLAIGLERLAVSMRAAGLSPAAAQVLVGLDGPDAEAASVVEAARPAWAGVAELDLVEFPRRGYIPIRRDLLTAARGRVVLSLNDDSWASPALVAAHLRAHARPGLRVVAGAMTWRAVVAPTLFDRLVQETDLIFFRGSANAAGTATPGPRASNRNATGPSSVNARAFRHVFGLNMSFPREAAQGVGGFFDLPGVYGYDDVELAFRLERQAGCGIVFEPEALVEHDHRFAPRDVLSREYALGRAAWAFAGVAPTFTAELFGRNVRHPDELAYARAYLARERRDAERLERSFMALSRHHANAAAAELLPTLAEHWVLLKRYLWRWGLLDASCNAPPPTRALATTHAADDTAGAWRLLNEGALAPGGGAEHPPAATTACGLPSPAP